MQAVVELSLGNAGAVGVFHRLLARLFVLAARNNLVVDPGNHVFHHAAVGRNRLRSWQGRQLELRSRRRKATARNRVSLRLGLHLSVHCGQGHRSRGENNHGR